MRTSEKLAGAGEEEAGERNIFRVTRSRLPWLLIAFLGELLSVVVLSGYEERLQDLIVITFFIPVVIAVAGNVGVQSSTIVVRGLATGGHSRPQCFPENHARTGCRTSERYHNLSTVHGDYLPLERGDGCGHLP